MKAVDRLLIKFCPEMAEQARKEFLYAFFPFIYGIYPYTVVTEKQREAMKQAQVDYAYPTVYQMTFDCAKKLLEAEERTPGSHGAGSVEGS